MAGFFEGKLLHSQYVRMDFATAAPATNATNAVLLATYHKGVKYMYIDNTLNAEIAILALPPEGDPSVVADKKLFVELPSNRVLNFDSLPNFNLSFPPQTSIYIYCLTIPTSGALRVLAWA